MSRIDDILATEYSEEFDNKRKNRMLMSYYKYGAVADNYTILDNCTKPLIDSMANLEIRVRKYKETGNIEFLLDVVNQAMIEYMYPAHLRAHFDSETHETRLEGMTIEDIKNLGGEQYE